MSDTNNMDKDELRDEVREAVEAVMKMEGNFDGDREGMIVMYGNGKEGKLVAALMGKPDSLHNTILNTMFKDRLAAELVINCANEYIKLKLFECDDEGCTCKNCESKRRDLNGLSAGDGEATEMTDYVEKDPKNIN